MTSARLVVILTKSRLFERRPSIGEDYFRSSNGSERDATIKKLELPFWKAFPAIASFSPYKMLSVFFERFPHFDRLAQKYSPIFHFGVLA